MFNFLTRSRSAEFPPIVFYDSNSQSKRPFTPLKERHVTMYACGPTVYDHIHIGNLRAYLLPDLIKRTLSYHGYEVKLTINFTDFGHLSDDGDAGEDKMVKGMKREGYPITLDAMREFAKPYIESFKRDNERLGNLPADTYTRASDYIKEQIKLIETLEQKGYTYETNDGVYFDISKFPAYGQLGNLNLEEMRAGARVEVNPEKKHPADFALWKKGNLGWQSRWGQGFPGWHIECTAMAFATLGKQIDIHTGGEDLMYTHHNGEIAQAESITNKPYVGYWLHNAHVTMAEQKLAKSAGNGFTLTDLVKKGYTAEDYRYWLLQSHYRTRVDFSFPALDAARQAMLRLKRFVYEEYDGILPTEVNKEYERDCIAALHDDLNTAKALSVLHEVIKDTTLSHGVKMATIHAIDNLLGLGLSKVQSEGQATLGYISPKTLPEHIQKLLTARDTAREEKNWAESDRLREQLQGAGYQLEDSAEGTKVLQN